MISDDVMKEFYRKLLDRLENISDSLVDTNEWLDELSDNLEAINTTLQKFGNYMGEKDGGIEVRNDLIR